MSMEAPLARRDWQELMVGVAAVWVIRGGGGNWGMEAFGFRGPLGLSIMVWSLSSAATHTHTREHNVHIQVISKKLEYVKKYFL